MRRFLTSSCNGRHRRGILPAQSSRIGSIWATGTGQPPRQQQTCLSARCHSNKTSAEVHTSGAAVTEANNSSNYSIEEDNSTETSSGGQQLGGADESVLQDMAKMKSPFLNYEFDIYGDAPYPIWFFDPEKKWYQAIMKATRFSADILEQWHQLSGLPWWATIAVSSPFIILVDCLANELMDILPLIF